jgi:predicted small lipoprotein YifL
MRRAIWAPVLMVVVALAACGDDGVVLLTDEAATTASSQPADTTTTTQPAEATSTTTGPPDSTTTSTVAPPTTTLAPSSTTTTTTTTTLPPPPGPLLFLPDGLSIVSFGASPPEAIGAVEAYLGIGPTEDTGWIGPYEFAVCPGTEFRMVSFRGLGLMFTDAGYFAPEGSRQFFAYVYYGDPPGISPGPPLSVDIGTTVDQIQALYPVVELYGDDPLFGPVFRVPGAGTWDQLWGQTTGTAPADTVVFLQGGVGCGE